MLVVRVGVNNFIACEIEGGQAWRVVHGYFFACDHSFGPMNHHVGRQDYKLSGMLRVDEYWIRAGAGQSFTRQMCGSYKTDIFHDRRRECRIFWIIPKERDPFPRHRPLGLNVLNPLIRDEAVWSPFGTG